MCDKLQYDSKGHALRQTAHMHKKRGRKHRYSAYLCPDCGKYHLTTVSKNIRPGESKTKYPFRYFATKKPKSKPKRNGRK